MIVPNVEDLAVVLFAADGFDPTKWNVMTSEQGGHIRDHYRKLAKVSIEWLTAQVYTPPLTVVGTVTMIPPPPPQPEDP